MNNRYKVVLVNPPARFGNDGSYSALPSLGLLYISASLKKSGVSSAVIDLNLKRYSAESAVEEILRHEPEYVGVSVMTTKLEASLLIARGVKLRAPGVKLIFGGPHINSTAASALTEVEQGRFVDFAFMKESEESFVSFVLGADHSRIPGLIHRGPDQAVRVNPSVIPDSDLDTLPFPDIRDVLNVRRYHSPFFRGGSTMTMMTSRGCPFSCSFCDVHQHMGRKYRLRSPENIVEEILFHRRNSSVQNIIFKDSIFNLNREHATAFCELLIRKNVRINWMCNSRINTVDDEIAGLMARAGCRNISLGVESLDPEMLRRMNKQITVEDIESCFRICRKHRINAVAYMIMGCEGDRYETSMASLARLIRLDPALAEFAVATIYPGTALYHESVAKGLLKDPKWYNSFGRDQKSKGYLSLPDFPVAEQILACEESYRRFYFRFPKLVEVFCRFFSLATFRVGARLLLSREKHRDI